MRNLFKKALIPILALTTLANSVSAETEVNYEEKLPYMFKEPTWETYQNGDSGLWPLPVAPPYSTGIYTMASHNFIDYKEDSNKFFDTASKYKSSGNTEVYYTSNPSTSVNMGLPVGSNWAKSVGGDSVLRFTFSPTKVNAYNNIQTNDELVMDSSQGQWLVTNGYYSRTNLDTGVSLSRGANGTTITASPLDTNPWGMTGTASFITPEDFLMGLSKSIYGVIQSRPVYMQTTPVRLARKITWFVVHPRNADGSCGPIRWTYQLNNWENQDVSYINPAWADTSPPACGSSKIIDRGEYIVHPEGYLNNVWFRYRNDQNSFVSPNVYELYFAKLLQKGILTTDAAFANASDSVFSSKTKKSDNFSFSGTFANRFYTEYQEFGKDVNASSKYKYPAWATELGALYTSPEISNIPLGHNITDKSIMVTFSGGANAYERALGVNYKLFGNDSTGVTNIVVDKDRMQIMSKTTVTIIDALRIIERAMRVEDGDMTETEASIITKKYGAQYLDSLKEEDRKTVSYLLAKGVINFENYQEYSNLYSPLSESFAYKLLYRIANKDARVKFTEITLTDSTDLPSNFSEYKQTIVKADLTQLSKVGSLTPTGKLVKNETKEPLTLLSDIHFLSTYQKLPESADGKIGTRYLIKADMDDPLKYLYRSMPMVLPDENGNPRMNADGTYLIYQSSSAKLYNNVDEKLKRYVGINLITKNLDTGRYYVEFYAYGEDYQTALTFIKANLQTRIASVTDKVEESSVISADSGAMSSVKGSDLNSSISSNNDLIVNRDFDLTAYSNSKTSIVGNNLVPGASAVKVGDQVLASLNVISKLTNTTAFDDVGTKEIVSVDSSQLKGLNTVVQNSAGETVGKTVMIGQQVTSRPTTKGKNDITKDVIAYNMSMLKSDDVLMRDQTFTFTNKDGDKQEVTGTVILSWRLDLPSDAEQNSLVGLNVSPNVNDGAKSSWLFTKPSNKSLLEVWNYNTGLNQAILKTFSGNNLSIKSGYFSPSIDVVIDSLNVKTRDAKGKEYNSDLTPAQLMEIENGVLNQIGENLSASWIKTYIGSVALANHKIGDKEDTSGLGELQKYQDSKLSDAQGIYVKPPGLLRGVKVPTGKTVWSELVFNQNEKNDSTSTYFDVHSSLSKFNMYTIYSSINGNDFYGEYFSGEGEGMVPTLVIPYARDNYKNLYKNVELSNYTYDMNTGILKQSSPGNDTGSKVGRKVKYKDQEFIVAADTPYTYKLYSTKFTLGVLKDGKIYQSTSGEMNPPLILDSIHKNNLAVFGTGQEKGINSAMFMKTEAFDFTPIHDLTGTDKKFLAIKNGVLSPYVYTGAINKDGSTSLKLSDTTLSEGEVIYAPSFVVLSKATWSITENQLSWNKKFLGADYSLYTQGSLVQGLKEQLLNTNSKNLVYSQDVKAGTLTIGKSTGKINGQNVTFVVPYEDGMISGSSINEQAVLDSFNLNADLTMTGNGEVGSAAQYLKNKKVGDYDPTYKDYHNTLVNNKGKLQVATGTKLVDYTPSTVVNSVSLTGMIMDGVRYLNNGANFSSGIYKVYQYQEVKPPSVVAPFTNGAPPVLNADNTIVANVASNFEPISTAMELFESLQRQLMEIAARNLWYFIVVCVLGLSVMLSISTLIAHVFASSPISNVFFERLHDITSIDFLAIMSVGVVRITGDVPNNWVKTARTSILLGVVPIVVFGVMRVYGLI